MKVFWFTLYNIQYSSLFQSGEQKREKKEKTADTISDPVLLEQYIVITDFKSKQRNQVS